MLTADQIRQTFLDFYEKKHAHTFVASSPVVPHEDPTLMFANAGMNQFKPIFLGQADPSTPLGKLRRAVNSQKCIRAGGKHNDLEDVGKDTYHHTFFEMLGTWSFGDYFKAESIQWGFELLTKVFGLDPNRLYATYFAGNPKQGLEPDDEARELWKKLLPAGHVLPGSMKDNFWEMGETGPCGPCSEIHYDRIGDRDASSMVNQSDPDVLEIWNHVFIQFNREEGGALKALPNKHVDTGMGHERLVSVLQNVRSNYDTDVFAPLFVAIERITGARKPYTGKLGAADKDNTDTAYRVIADHIRTLTFAINDGAQPSNEGRGYVLRRILRRAVRYGSQMLQAKTGFLSQLVPVVVERMGGAFPELKKNPQSIIDIIRGEEESFGKTLARGIVLFDEACIKAFGKARLIPHLQTAGATLHTQRDENGWLVGIADKGGVLTDSVRLTSLSTQWADAHFSPARGIAAEDAFKLYDTFGFPFDLTNLMAEERGLKVDMAGFEMLMEQAREKARAGGGFKAEVASLSLPPDAIARLKHMNVEPTDDVDKFHGRDIKARVLAIWNGTDFDDSADGMSAGMAPVGIVTDRTNFYAEMGGQLADSGRITSSNNSDGDDTSSVAAVGAGGEFKVESAHAYAGFVVHVGRVSRKQVRVGDDVIMSLDSTRRGATAGHHTATHLVNLALRANLGVNVEQKGSLVAPDRMRFDFSHNKPVSHEELAKIELLVQQGVAADLQVHTELMPLEQAKKIKGVRAVFGEAYPDPVRVVSIGRAVSDLASEADEAKASLTSAEFCGGTHVVSTAHIGAFVLVSEEAVAKGIRRVSGLSGVPAMAAQRAAEGLRTRLAGAAKLGGEELSREAREIGVEIDSLTLPLVSKHELRAALASLQDRVKAAGKAAAQAFLNEVAARAKSSAEGAEWDHGSFIVTTIDAASDREALSAAMNIFRTRRPRSAVLLISQDKAADKLSILASCPDGAIKRGLTAGDWVKAASAACGGKGGGKPDLAQAGGTDVTKLKDTLAAATAFAFGKCPN